MLARALTGVGEASYTVVTPSLMSDYYPAERRGRALAMFYAAIPVGIAPSAYMVGGRSKRTSAGGRRSSSRARPGAAPGAVLLHVPRSRRAARFDASRPAGAAPTVRDSASRALRARPSYIYNTVAQTIYTFAIGGLAAWMPTYFVRARQLPQRRRDANFGGLLVLAGFAGTLLGGRGGRSLSRRRADGHFLLSGVTLIASLPFTLLAILHPSPAIFWPAMFVTLLLLLRQHRAAQRRDGERAARPSCAARGFAINTMAIHLLGDALSPLLIGVVSDRIGLAHARAGHRPAAGAWRGWCCWRAARRCARDLQAAAVVPA